VLPHFYAPRSWHLPLDLGLVAESSFQKATYEENVRRVEVRPTLEKGFGKLRVDFNPVFEVHCTARNQRRLDLRADLKLAKNVEWSFGAGIGATPAGNRLSTNRVLKSLSAYGRTDRGAALEALIRHRRSGAKCLQGAAAR